MSSTLGGSFGLAIPVTVYSAVEKTGNMGAAASIGLLANAVFARLALLAIVTIIPKDSVKKSLESGINEPLEDRESLLLKVAKKIN
ncbi:hypothetical protein [Oceanobacillus sp. CF4.6]|uniref:hypothetical protein n=1 Tax=Oceanobacillus sp. CF4.6 TaxID=3373080 RepID=UPI003EE70494